LKDRIGDGAAGGGLVGRCFQAIPFASSCAICRTWTGDPLRLSRP
jgi:hypothetical protein